MIIAHNHPGGSKVFSDADQKVTTVLRDTLGKINIRLPDYILVAGEEYASYEEMGIGGSSGTFQNNSSNTQCVSEQCEELLDQGYTEAEIDTEVDFEVG